jgi:hypothetical protein
LRVRFKSVALAAVVALAVHGCAAEPPRDVPIQPAVTTAAGDPGEIVCRDQEQTGTRFKKQTCRERSQIDEETRQSRDTMREALRKGGNTADAGVMPGN